MSDRPIVYLDIDDVLVAWPTGSRRGEAAPHAARFLRWLRKEHFEVRWLTSWCPSGTLSTERREKLAKILGIETEELQGIRNPRPFRPIIRYPRKHEAIDFGTDTSWVVVHDEHWHAEDLEMLDRANCLDCFIEVNTSRRPDDLRRAQAEIARRFRRAPWAD